MARRPALLISDESTSMLDAAGRAEVLDLLAALPARTGTAVVHVTHDPAEAARADRVIGLADGRIVDAAAAGHGVSDDEHRVPPRATAVSRTAYRSLAPRPGSRDAAGEPVIRVRGVGHRFDAGTPWEVTALRSVDLDVHEGEGLLITGENGSGKTTLAWVLAGLIRPTEGTAMIDGAPASASVGAVALSFQHARLQLQRPTVAEDILAAAGFDATLGRGGRRRVRADEPAPCRPARGPRRTRDRRAERRPDAPCRDRGPPGVPAARAHPRRAPRGTRPREPEWAARAARPHAPRGGPDARRHLARPRGHGPRLHPDDRGDRRHGGPARRLGGAVRQRRSRHAPDAPAWCSARCQVPPRSTGSEQRRSCSSWRRQPSHRCCCPDGPLSPR